jgi:hypothetical protein
MIILHLNRIVILLIAFLFLLIVVSCEEDSPSEPNGNGQTITVSGFVKDFDGELVAGVPVIIKGKAPVTTDANGGFTISNVSKPYEVRVIFSTDQAAIVYQGLTRSDPTLIYLGVTSSWKTATISGSIPPAAGKITRVFFTSGAMSWSTNADQGTGLYNLTVDWKGSANSMSGKLQVLRWTQNVSGMPIQYDAYGFEDNLTVSAGGTFPDNNFTAANLTDPPEQNISGSIVRPSSSYDLYNKILYLFFGSAEIYLGEEWGVGLSDNFSYVVPSISGTTFGVDASASLNATPTDRYTNYGKRGITGGSSGITINLASSPQLNIPAHNGSGIDTTTQFLWTKGSGGGICLLYVRPTMWGTGPSFWIFTATNSASIPNLAPQGMGLPSNISYLWSVTQVFPVSSIDDAASSNFLQQTSGSTEGGQASSEEFNFITKTSP